ILVVFLLHLGNMPRIGVRNGALERAVSGQLELPAPLTFRSFRRSGLRSDKESVFRIGNERLLALFLPSEHAPLQEWSRRIIKRPSISELHRDAEVVNEIRGGPLW